MTRKERSEIKHLIYYSIPTSGDTGITKDILETSRENNSESGVTGALICRSDLYFQFLEGPIDAVDQTFEKIKLDKRHKYIHKIKESITNRRLFATWAMREDPVKTWMWTRKDVKDGILKQIKPSEAFNTFERLSREVDQFSK